MKILLRPLRSRRFAIAPVALVVCSTSAAISSAFAQAAPPQTAPAPSVPVAPPSAVVRPSIDVRHTASAPANKDAQVAKQAPSKQSQWLPQEIEEAQRACVAQLKDLDLVAIGATPVRDGDCGAPAPIELISVGKSPQVTFNPPVIVTCDMAAALHKWVTGDLQGLAKKHLGAPLIRIETMSSYSCRTAYGRRHARLSEHGRANAIDIRAFLTAKAEPVDLLAHWGPTERDIAARIAAAKAAEQQRALAAQQQKAPQPGQPGAPAVAGTNPVAVGGIPQVGEAAKPGVTIAIPGTNTTVFPQPQSAIGLSTGISTPPSRLGGPKPAQSAQQPPAAGAGVVDLASGRAQFLRGAHSSACKIFGTVLGPEANEAHRNHFHVDMARRATTSFCE